jgi:uncharacterized protein with ACT and thioredoxin-like domain
MKKLASGTISNPERHARRMLRLTTETVRLLGPVALVEVISGCNSTTSPDPVPGNSQKC